MKFVKWSAKFIFGWILCVVADALWTWMKSLRITRKTTLTVVK